MTKTLKDVTAVYRTYRCDDCGYHHEHGVHVDIDEPGSQGDYAKGKPVVGRWLCSDCGSEWWRDDVRLTSKDLKDCEF